MPNYAENKNPKYIDAHEALIIWNLPSEPINKIQNPTIFFSNLKN